MNDYLTRQLIADRQAAVTASMRHRAQVREALAARRSPTGKPLPRLRLFGVTAKRAARAILAGPALTQAGS